MKRNLFILLALIFSGFFAKANQVDSIDAKKAAYNYLHIIGEPCIELQLKHVLTGNNNQTAIYIFDIDNAGFIMISADNEVEPVLGYSYGGVYDHNRVSPSFRSWSESYRDDIAQIATLRKEKKAHYSDPQAACKWQALLNGDAGFFATKGPQKSVTPLVQTKWDQGWGYNEYTPLDSDGNHVVTGCVATAAAQVIRYWGYPSTGFGSSSYNHRVYGRLSANYDSAYYDYSQMPNQLSYSSTNSQIHHVAQLIYHCGVAVEMNYQSPYNTDGSSATTESLEDALIHFGYVGSHMEYKGGRSEAEWGEMLRAELDEGRPMVYRGTSSSGGHAFVCDGYRTGDNKYHFNWGWSGYQDGFYTIANMNGYTGAQGAVMGIIPSHIAACDTLYVRPGATGDGSSYANATSKINECIQLRSMYRTGVILIGEGVHQLSEPIGLRQGIYLFGGIGGSDTTFAQRNPSVHVSVLDGNGEIPCLSLLSSYSKATVLEGITIRNSYSDNHLGSIVDKVKIRNCRFEDNTCTGDKFITFAGGTLSNCTFTRNNVPNGALLYMDGNSADQLTMVGNNCMYTVRYGNGNLRSSLIAHNTSGIKLDDYGNVISCHIVGNQGVGVELGNHGSLISSVVWNNDTNLIVRAATSEVLFCALPDSTNYGDSTFNIYISSINDDPQGPQFYHPLTQRGPVTDTFNYHFPHSSPLVNQGTTNKAILSNYDLDGLRREREGRVDIGCYETEPPVSIPIVDNSIVCYPNPTTGVILVSIPEGNNSIDIYNMQGQRVVHQKGIGEATISLRHLPNGIYIIRSGGASAKIIKR